jgi:hypothetical protein
MTLRGAAKTQTEQIAQVHPTAVSRREPSRMRDVQSMIKPKSTTLNKISSFAVYICGKSKRF